MPSLAQFLPSWNLFSRGVKQRNKIVSGSKKAEKKIKRTVIENKKAVKIYRLLRVTKEGCFGQLILNLRLDR